MCHLEYLSPTWNTLLRSHLSHRANQVGLTACRTVAARCQVLIVHCDECRLSRLRGVCAHLVYDKPNRSRAVSSLCIQIGPVETFKWRRPRRSLIVPAVDRAEHSRRDVTGLRFARNYNLLIDTQSKLRFQSKAKRPQITRRFRILFDFLNRHNELIIQRKPEARTG